MAAVMRSYEVIFDSVNSESYAKPITVLVVEPDRRTPDTGALICTHGWGGNRRDYRETMEYAADAHNLVCLSAEFRGSGYDFNPVTGRGAGRPYDASFYQVFDVLNALRFILELIPGLQRQRLYHYGGSQGGFIALLSAIFAPRTFASIYATSSITSFDATHVEWAGRTFTPHELSVRNVVEHAHLIGCPVYLEHGTADSIVPWEHTRRLEERLRSLGKSVRARYHEGGEHSLQPVTTRLQTFRETAPEMIGGHRNREQDDFAAGGTVKIPCGDRKLVIDWSKPRESVELFRWEETA